MPKLRDGFKGQRLIVIPSFIIEHYKQHPLGKLLFITDIGYYPNASYHFCERKANEAKENILIYCQKGKGWYQINGKRYEVSQNQFFIIPANVAHCYGSNNDSPWSIYWLHFIGEMSEFFRKGFYEPTDIIIDASKKKIEHQLYLFDEIYNTLDEGFTHDNIMYTITSLFHFLGLMKYNGEYTEHERSGKIDCSDIAISFMHDNIGRKLTLEEIAKEVKLSVSHFSKIFMKRTGHSPLQYLNLLRIKKACYYLNTTTLKINQISPLVGIDDSFYFSRMFTKIMGMSPSQYRENKKY